MNKKDDDNIQLEKFLTKKKALGIPSIIYSLNSKQLYFVQKQLGYETIPFIYRIYTKKLIYRDIRYKGGLLRQIYHANQNNKSQIHRPLNHSEKELLREHGIFYVPVKYIVKLK